MNKTLEALMAKYKNYQIEMRRYFHAHPEESEKEFNTAKKIREELDKIGVKWRTCGLGTGTLAVVEGAHPGKTILLRGDIDALSVQEETECEYKSTVDGMMHACGHDCHGSMLLTAVHMINDIKDKINGRVVFAFQPAEEVGTGAKAMVAEGALDGVDVCFGMHVWPDLPAGQVDVRNGPVMACGDQFKIEIFGKGGHGAQPHKTIDATVAASSVVMNLQTIVSRQVSPVDSAVVTVGKLNSGTRFNVISGYAFLEGTVRCFDRELRASMESRISKIASNTAEALGCTAKTSYTYIVPPTINTPEVAEMARKACAKVLGADGVVTDELTLGGEDFAYFLEHIPGAFARFGVGHKDKPNYSLHNGKFSPDEDALILGAATYTQVACDYLGVDLED